MNYNLPDDFGANKQRDNHYYDNYVITYNDNDTFNINIREVYMSDIAKAPRYKNSHKHNYSLQNEAWTKME